MPPMHCHDWMIQEFKGLEINDRDNHVGEFTSQMQRLRAGLAWVTKYRDPRSIVGLSWQCARLRLAHWGCSIGSMAASNLVQTLPNMLVGVGRLAVGSAIGIAFLDD